MASDEAQSNEVWTSFEWLKAVEYRFIIYYVLKILADLFLRKYVEICEHRQVIRVVFLNKSKQILFSSNLLNCCDPYIQ